MPENVMEKEAYRTTQRLNQFWYESYQAVMQSAFEAQSRSIQYAQSVFTDGLETLKDHLEASRNWLQATASRAQDQTPVPSLMDTGVEAYKRNIQFLQRTLERGGETFKGHTDAMRYLTDTLLKKAEEQRDMAQREMQQEMHR